MKKKKNKKDLIKISRLQDIKHRQAKRFHF